MEAPQTIFIGIESLFIILIMMASMRSVSVNQHGYSRTLRVSILLLSVFYLIDYALNFTYLLLTNDNLAMASIGLVSFLAMSFIIIHITVVFDYKKISVRKVWEIKSGYDNNFKTARPFSHVEVCSKIFKLFSLLIIAGFSVSVIAIEPKEKYAWIIMLSSSLQLFMIITIAFSASSFKNILKMNIEYNYLKNIIIQNDNKIAEEHKKTIAIKTENLYNKLFTNSFWYIKAKNTNEAIKDQIKKFSKK